MQQIELIEPPPPGAEPAGQLGLPANIAAAAPPLSATTLVSSSATAASCSALIGSLFGDCAVSLDRISLAYNRGSDQPPSLQETTAALQGLAAAGLPPDKCCAACETITATSCLCSSGARAALLEWLQGQGSAVELAFVQGAASILHTACALGAIHPCLTNAGGM